MADRRCLCGVAEIAPREATQMTIRRKAVGSAVAWIKIQRLIEERDSLGGLLGGKSPRKRQGAEVKVVRFEAFGRLAFGSLNLSLFQPGCDRTHHACSYPVLQIENVLEGALEAVRPDKGPR